MKVGCGEMVNALVSPKGTRRRTLLLMFHADVVELVVTSSSEGDAERRGGSSPLSRTTNSTGWEACGSRFGPEPSSLGSTPSTLTMILKFRGVDRSLVPGLLWEQVRKPRGFESLLPDHQTCRSINTRFKSCDTMAE